MNTTRKNPFTIKDHKEFNEQCIHQFNYQYNNNPVYKRYCNYLLGNKQVHQIEEIPFLPIEFFKTHDVVITGKQIQQTFTSSGTTGSTVSRHLVHSIEDYHSSLDLSFKEVYGNIEDYVVLGLLPHYLDRTGSSLVHMVNRWIQQSKHEKSGFYLRNMEDLIIILQELKDKKVILIGVTFALLQLAEMCPMDLPNTIIIETGGMKGMRKEIIKSELHDILKISFSKAQIHSEYGMTELLSQAYSSDGRLFKTPNWMRVSARQLNDPLSSQDYGKTGGLNIIDLANYYSCSFIATQDLGKVYQDGTFEVLGRFDHSDIRGCNLMATT
ncbi:LuxE/PaaK family acyltransferase [Nonlabens tegetincola]|uniref:LuxE/PaaK family acyltransferase n=1 Tax=Nonlabens tegetincola TaxID=323273 RepID=UPI000CF5611C|nr:acyl transferase [Nonlabens tegetincola]PQJ18991.1 acyl transferase [Nonlabens tegetincola]